MLLILLWCLTCCSTNRVRYDVCDIYDLDEFDQKGGVRTRYGTGEEPLELVETAEEYGVVIYVGTVLNLQQMTTNDSRLRG